MCICVQCLSEAVKRYACFFERIVPTTIKLSSCLFIQFICLFCSVHVCRGKALMNGAHGKYKMHMGKRVKSFFWKNFEGTHFVVYDFHPTTITTTTSANMYKNTDDMFIHQTTFSWEISKIVLKCLDYFVLYFNFSFTVWTHSNYW